MRIGPNQLSVMDAHAFTRVIYKQGSEFHKVRSAPEKHSLHLMLLSTDCFQDPNFYGVFANEHQNVFSTSNPEDHSQYRRLLSNSFSRKSILVFEKHIWEKASLWSVLLQRDLTVVDLTKLFRCFALDVVSEFIYGESFGALLKPRFEEELLDAFDKFSPASYFVSTLYE